MTMMIVSTALKTNNRGQKLVFEIVLSDKLIQVLELVRTTVLRELTVESWECLESLDI